MQSRFKRATLFLLLALTVVHLPASVATLPVPARFHIARMRADFDDNGAHLGIEIAPSRAKPPYQVYFDIARCAVIIDLRNVDAAQAALPRLEKNDYLVLGWELDHPNFLTTQWVVRLGYAVPTSRIHAHFSANTLQVDIGRNFSDRQSMAVTRNVRWSRQQVRAGDDYFLLNEVEIRPDKKVALRVVHAGDSIAAMEDPVTLAQRKGALTLINGGFFRHQVGPVGLVVEDGRILVPPVTTRPPRTALGITRDGRIMMNRVEMNGGRLSVVDGKADWSDVAFAVGGGPRIIRDGRASLTTDDEALGPGGNDITRKAGRTVVARLRNGHLLLVTISGYRDNHLQGWQFPELIHWLLKRGAVDAMGLDGGGSTAMVISGALVSKPPARSAFQRRVPNALMVTDQSPVLLPARVKLTAPRSRVRADGLTPLKVVAEVTNCFGKPVPDGTRVYFSTTAGVVSPVAATRKGRAAARFIPLRSVGSSRLLAFAGLVSAETTIFLEGGPPIRLAARLLDVQDAPPSPTPSIAGAPGPLPTPIRSTARVAQLEMMVLDVWQNALPDQDVDVDVGSGRQRVHIGPSGVVRVSLPLSADVRTLRVAHGALQALQIAVP